MRIAFDQQVFLLQEYGGISRYVCSLAKALTEIPSVEAKIFAPLHYNGHLQELADSLVFGSRVPSIKKTTRIITTLSEIVAKKAISNYKPNVLHETYYSSHARKYQDMPSVVTVYDMINEKFSDNFIRSEYGSEQKRITVERADHVICISESTRRDLLELFDIPEDKVSVVYLGYDELSACDSRNIASTTTIASPYLLYVGSRGGYKNFEGFLRAIASSSFLKNNFSVICFGGGRITQKEAALIDEIGLDAEKIKQVGGGDDMLATLYKSAEAFIYPSRYEGFGIPPLEAMSLGCPVIYSNTSSLPEVVGDAGESFDPANLESVSHVIEAVMHSPTKRTELIQKGYERCKMFSWSRCAQETVSIYRGLI